VLQAFTTKSNLTRHQKVHQEKSVVCRQCDKTVTLQQQLKVHLSQHARPNLQLYNSSEALLKATDEAQQAARIQKEPVAAVWLDAVTAESEARKTAGGEWRSQLHIAFGKYAGQTFKWLLENGVGWVVWLLHEYAESLCLYVSVSISVTIC